MEFLTRRLYLLVVEAVFSSWGANGHIDRMHHLDKPWICIKILGKKQVLPWQESKKKQKKIQVNGWKNHHFKARFASSMANFLKIWKHSSQILLQYICFGCPIFRVYYLNEKSKHTARQSQMRPNCLVNLKVTSCLSLNGVFMPGRGTDGLHLFQKITWGIATQHWCFFK